MTLKKRFLVNGEIRDVLDRRELGVIDEEEALSTDRTGITFLGFVTYLNDEVVLWF